MSYQQLKNAGLPTATARLVAKLLTKTDRTPQEQKIVEMAWKEITK